MDIVKRHHVSCTKSESCQNVYVQGDGCSSMHMDYIFLIENGNFFSSQHCTYFFLHSEFGVSIHNERNRPVLDNYGNKIVRISLNSFDLLLKVNRSRYIALFAVSRSIKQLFLIDFVNSYLFPIFFSIVFMNI